LSHGFAISCAGRFYFIVAHDESQPQRIGKVDAQSKSGRRRRGTGRRRVDFLVPARKNEKRIGTANAVPMLVRRSPNVGRYVA
jgi:hypothetical protein